MKYTVTTLCLLLFLSVSYAADSAGNYAIWGVGQKSCYHFSKARENKEDDSFRNYLMGYLTAYNALTPDTYRISASKNLDDILVWLDAHCETRQVHSFEQAISEFITEQYPQRYKSVAAGQR